MVRKYPTGKALYDMSIAELIDGYRAGDISEPDFILWMQRRGAGFDTIMNVIAE